MEDHARKKHPDEAPPAKFRRLKTPRRFPENEFQFVKQMVRRCVGTDKGPYGVLGSDEENHRLAIELLDELVRRRLVATSNVTDMCGGFLRDGYVFEAHGGLFKLSLDRLDNDRAHFRRGFPALDNVQFVPLALNHQSNPVNHHGAKLCSVLRAKRLEPVSSEQVQRALQAEDTSGTRKKANTLYKSCNNVWNNKYREGKKKGQYKDPACREAFATLQRFFQYVKTRLREQECRCAVSGLFLLGRDAAAAMYKRSVDAIDPRKGHVPGNVRIVCSFLNSTNCIKDAKLGTRHPAWWTRELFEEWVGAPRHGSSLSTIGRTCSILSSSRSMEAVMVRSST